MTKRNFFYKFLLCNCLIVSSFANTNSPLKHAKSLFGEPKYPMNFQHFDYVNPNAPKGGTFKQAVVGSFDTLNPYAGVGVAASGSAYQYDTLLARSKDEPLTKYGLIAEYIEESPENKWVIFHINKKARFSNQTQVTAEDVKFSFDILRQKGSPFYKQFYQDVDYVSVQSSTRVFFQFKHNKNKELITNLGQMPIFSKEYWQQNDFANAKLNIPIGSGPYQVAKVDPGRSIVYKRNPNYWAKDLPVNKGMYNFDYLNYTYYLNSEVSYQAFLAGEYDFLNIITPKVWNYFTASENQTSLKTKGIKTLTIKNTNPRKIILFYNTRKPYLKDRATREAIDSSLDFNWLNKLRFHNMYTRSDSYFAGTELESTGTPTTNELKWLHPWKHELPDALFNQPFQRPKPFAISGNRDDKKHALKLLHSAGWRINNSQQTDSKGNPATLTLLMPNTYPEYETIAIAMQQGLEKIGIKLNIHSVDNAQFIQRIRSFDFDLVPVSFGHTLSPGVEQISFFGSYASDQSGSLNFAGIKNPVVDSLVTQLPKAKNRQDLIGLVQSLDRVLLWNHYAMPVLYLSHWHIAFKNHLHQPNNQQANSHDFINTWWYEKNKQLEL